jgi:hypothetical protein
MTRINSYKWILALVLGLVLLVVQIGVFDACCTIIGSATGENKISPPSKVMDEFPAFYFATSTTAVMVNNLILIGWGFLVRTIFKRRSNERARFTDDPLVSSTPTATQEDQETKHNEE